MLRNTAKKHAIRLKNIPTSHKRQQARKKKKLPNVLTLLRDKTAFYCENYARTDKYTVWAKQKIF